MTERLHFHFSLSCIGEGNGNPLQCSCLGNPGDGGAWWAAISGVAQSRTRLKRLSSSSSSRVFIKAHRISRAGALQGFSSCCDVSSNSGSGRRSPEGEHGNPLQDSCLENPTDRGAWRATVQRVRHD